MITAADLAAEMKRRAAVSRRGCDDTSPTLATYHAKRAGLYLAVADLLAEDAEMVRAGGGL